MEAEQRNGNCKECGEEVPQEILEKYAGLCVSCYDLINPRF